MKARQQAFEESRKREFGEQAEMARMRQREIDEVMQMNAQMESKRKDQYVI